MFDPLTIKFFIDLLERYYSSFTYKGTNVQRTSRPCYNYYLVTLAVKTMLSDNPDYFPMSHIFYSIFTTSLFLY